MQSHFEPFLWLQGKPRIPAHEIMIAAWRDFSLGLVYFDTVSSLSGLRTQGVSQNNLSPLVKRLFSYWYNHNRAPFVLNIAQGLFKEDELEYALFNNNFNNMKSAVIHGIKDCRGHIDIPEWAIATPLNHGIIQWNGQAAQDQSRNRHDSGHQCLRRQKSFTTHFQEA